MSIRTILSFILFCSMRADADAQSASTDSIVNDTIASSEARQSLGKHLNEKLTNIYFNTKYDTNYVIRPKEKWLIKLVGNYSGNHIHAKGIINDIYSRYDLHTRSNTTIGIWVSYCDLAVELSVNPEKLSGSNSDYELNLEYHGNRLSVDFNFLHAMSLTGDMKLGDIDHLNENGLCMNMVSITGYYTFNHRRFSFPAALYQNYYQRRSAGSWLAGLSFQGGNIKTTDELKERNPQAPEVRLNIANVAFGGGYGYNLVLGRQSQWLIHLSALPSFVVYKHNRLIVNNDEKRDHGFSFNMIFNERAAVVYHFSSRYLTGASVIMSNAIFNNDKVTFKQNKWFTRAFFGMRL